MRASGNDCRRITYNNLLIIQLIRLLQIIINLSSIIYFIRYCGISDLGETRRLRRSALKQIFQPTRVLSKPRFDFWSSGLLYFLFSAFLLLLTFLPSYHDVLFNTSAYGV